MGLHVRIPTGEWMYVSFACCALLGNICDGSIPHPTYCLCVCVT